MIANLIQLIGEEVISLADLAGFSDALRERMEFLFRDKADGSLQ